MKTTEDEKKIIEMYHETVHQLKAYRNSYVELNKLVDDYLRTLKGFPFLLSLAIHSYFSFYIHFFKTYFYYKLLIIK